jgi:TctA family transporter
MFICICSPSVKNWAFDIMLLLVFGGFGYLSRLLAFTTAPLRLGFVLGPLLEEHFRRAMLLSRGSFSTFIDRLIGATPLGIAAVILLWTMVGGWLRPARKAADNAG